MQSANLTLQGRDLRGGKNGSVPPCYLLDLLAFGISTTSLGLR